MITKIILKYIELNIFPLYKYMAQTVFPDAIPIQTNNFNIDKRKNSFQDPYQIIDIAHIAINPVSKGRLSISIAPGKKDHRWNRDLQMDLNIIKQNGVQTIVCLLEWSEMTMLGIADYPRIAQENGLIFYHLPIKDRNIPLKKEIDALIPTIVQRLSNGQNVLVHCRGGLGRAGTVCACCLAHFGYDGPSAVNLVRQQRPGAVQTLKQEECVLNYCGQFIQGF